MDSARSILQLETSLDESELLSVLRALTVPELRLLCKENGTKTSGNKSAIIGRLITPWKEACEVCPQVLRAVSDPCSDLPDFEEIRSWTKDLSSLRDLTFVQLYNYLVSSKEKTFDKDSMNAFKSLKAYKYFADGLISNVWTCHMQQEGRDEVVIKGYCCSSLKAKATYTVYVVLQTTGKVVGGACNCVAGKGQTCSHVAALLFYLEDLKQKGLSTLPTCETVTGQLQQWHVPPKRNVVPKRVSDITFHKASYGKLEKIKSNQAEDNSPITSTSKDVSQSTGIEHNIPTEDDRPPDDDTLTTLVQTIASTYPQSGLAHFWLTPSSDQADSTLMPPLAEDHDVQDGLLQLTHKLIIWDGINTALPQSAIELDGVNTETEYFKELCREFEQEQIINSTLSNFIEQVTHGQSSCDLWMLLHNGRITSSLFGEIMQRRESTDPASIQRRIMGYTPMLGLSAPLRWGRDKESVARKAYVQECMTWVIKICNVIQLDLHFCQPILTWEHLQMGSSQITGTIRNVVFWK